MSISKSEPWPSLLRRLVQATHYAVAYSGGVDSHVLLHALCAQTAERGARLTAVHVNHGLHAHAADWARHCAEVCRQLGVPLQVLRVDAGARPGESPEAAARRARYRALAEWLPKEAVLLSGQHRDDQAETVLLQLFRGAGARGLAAMPAIAPLGAGRLARPLLGCSRAEILAYARRHRLQWIEDPSNADIRYDRNLLRQQLLPAIRQRWRGVDKALVRAARLQADQAELATVLAGLDLAHCEIEGQPDQLRAPALQSLARARQRNLLRHWIEANQLPLPAEAIIDQIIDSLLEARPDAGPVVHWSGAEVRRYRQRLYIMPPLPRWDPGLRLPWDPRQPLALPAAGGTLRAAYVSGQGLRAPAHTQLQVGFRQGGETLQPAGRAGHHSLKKLFQEWRVPPWRRTRVPLVFYGNALAAVAGYCICEDFLTNGDERGFELFWHCAAMPQAR